jgi:hypothetical protein
MTAALSSINVHAMSSVEPTPPSIPLQLPPIDYDVEDEEAAGVEEEEDEEANGVKRMNDDNKISSSNDSRHLDSPSILVSSENATPNQDLNENNNEVIVVTNTTMNSIQQMFKNEMKFMQSSNGSSKTLGKTKANRNENNLNSTSISTSGGGGGGSGGRFYAIRNWLKQNRWRKKSGKQTPPPPLVPPLPPSAQNTPTTTQIPGNSTFNSSIFSSLFESNNTEMSVKSASTILSKKGAKLKLKENNLTISNSGGMKVKESKSKKATSDKKLNNTITNTGTYSSKSDVEVSSLITPHKNQLKTIDISTPVSSMMQQTKNENDIDVLDKSEEFDINLEFSNEVNSLSSKLR